jgi:A/G-specific adenine glycosylase
VPPFPPPALPVDPRHRNIIATHDTRPALLAWYDRNRRELPWRAAPGERADPYRVWLSEVMLQQTRVEAVRPYFQRWLERFPTLAALAAADHDEVMKAWEGLGYYSRARNLHRAVREVEQHYGGRVPDDPAAFRALPGVGRYTAGAVMSIAFDREEPVVDGNVRRVLARWQNLPEPSDAALWAAAAELVCGERPGDLNQALMELGATVCTPRSPRCGSCPVSHECAAFAAGTQEQVPSPRTARPLPHEQVASAVVWRGSEVLLARRPPTGRLGGLWEFPGAVVREGEGTGAAAARAAREGVGAEIEVGDEIGAVDHVFTHVRVTYTAVRCTLLAGELRPLLYERLRWLPLERLGEVALPRAQQRLAALARAR